MPTLFNPGKINKRRRLILLSENFSMLGRRQLSRVMKGGLIGQPFPKTLVLCFLSADFWDLSANLPS
jgi:hypothetical protein